MIKILFFSFLIVSSYSFGQSQEKTQLNTFYLENVQNSELNTLYSERIITGNFESFRLKNTPVELVFEEGFKCILLPASHLVDFAIDANNYQESFPNQFLLPIFHFTENGGIVAIYQKTIK